MYLKCKERYVIILIRFVIIYVVSSLNCWLAAEKYAFHPPHGIPWPLTPSSHPLGRAEDRLDLMEKEEKDPLICICQPTERDARTSHIYGGESPFSQGRAGCLKRDKSTSKSNLHVHFDSKSVTTGSYNGCGRSPRLSKANAPTHCE